MTAADCIIIDGNCIIQILPLEAENFNALAQGFMNSIMATNRKIGDVTQTHVVFDRYLRVVQRHKHAMIEEVLRVFLITISPWRQKYHLTRVRSLTVAVTQKALLMCTQSSCCSIEMTFHQIQQSIIRCWRWHSKKDYTHVRRRNTSAQGQPWRSRLPDNITLHICI